MEIFWKTIGLYNSATWICQALIVAVGIALTIALRRKPGRVSSAAMKLFLIFLYLWIAVAYFYVCCAEREYSNIMAIFWGILACSWIWDLATGYTTFKRKRRHTRFATVLLLMPFLYPAVSLLRGMEFPMMTSPVMPCSVVVFTIGVLLMFAHRVNIFIVLLLCHWSMIGLSKTFFFNIPEDYLLTCATIPAIYYFFKEQFLGDMRHETKPQAKYLNWMLMGICVCLGTALAVLLFVELFKAA